MKEKLPAGRPTWGDVHHEGRGSGSNVRQYFMDNKKNGPDHRDI